MFYKKKIFFSKKILKLIFYFKQFCYINYCLQEMSSIPAFSPVDDLGKYGWCGNSYFFEDDVRRNFELEFFASKGSGGDRDLGHYSVIGMRNGLYYWISLGDYGKTIEHHILAQHYCHLKECGQTYEELLASIKRSEDGGWGSDQYCRGFPLKHKIPKSKKKDIWNEALKEDRINFVLSPWNKGKCYICSEK